MRIIGLLILLAVTLLVSAIVANQSGGWVLLRDLFSFWLPAVFLVHAGVHFFVATNEEASKRWGFFVVSNLLFFGAILLRYDVGDTASGWLVVSALAGNWTLPDIWPFNSDADPLSGQFAYYNALLFVPTAVSWVVLLLLARSNTAPKTA